MQNKMTKSVKTNAEVILQAQSRGYKLVMTNGTRTPESCPQCKVADSIFRFKRYTKFVFACKCGWRRY